MLLAGSAVVMLVAGSGAASAGVDTDADPGPAPGAGIGHVAPESDVAHHGYVHCGEGRIRVAFTTSNHGPSDLEDVTVRLSLSVVPAGVTRLPRGCLRAGEQELLCSTGPLRSEGLGRKFGLELRTGAESPHEFVLTVGTAWNGGASDRNPHNNDHRVLVPATGDRYVF